MKIKNTKFYYLIIVLYGMFMVLITTGFSNVFGSEIDWVGQHSVFPETFRQNFYETGRLLPNFVFETGGGQNIFNFSYYGLLSPMFILSYLFPFVDMVVYTCIVGVLQYIVGGVLMYVFLKKHFSKTNSLLAAIVFLSLAPLVVYARYHIMFVWYMPFLLLAFIGLDRYFEKKKSSLFIISAVCIILTNYYFSVGCLVSLFVYAIYRILKEDEFTWKGFVVKGFKTGLMFVVPALMCGFFLLPTMCSLMTGSRPHEVALTTEMYLIPKISNLFFEYFSYGITGTMLVGLVSNLCSKNTKKWDRFLNIVLVVITICPLVPYALNGTLYLSSKVIIPFLPLYIYCFVQFIRNLKEKTAPVFVPVAVVIAFALVCYLVHNSKTNQFLFVVADVLLVLLCFKKPRLIFGYTTLVLIVAVFNNDIPYASYDFVNSMYTEDINSMMETAPKGNYRSNVSYNDRYTCNRTYGENYLGVSSYSSTPNRDYLDFYENHMGNNEGVRNSIMVTGSRNELFYSFMGTRYIFSDQDPGFLYEKVEGTPNINMYENKNPYPLAYKAKNTVSEADFDKVAFPYNLEILMNNTVVEKGNVEKYQSSIEKYPVSQDYEFENTQEVSYTMEVSEKLKDKIVYLTFNVENTGDYETRKVLEIVINGSSNLVNDKQGTYYNENTKFEYVISMEDKRKLDITVSEGKFKIYGLEMYYSDVYHEKYTEADDLKLNEDNDTITCKVDAAEGEYFVTSIPYDKGFVATINGKEVEIEKINKAFVGFKLREGTNDIVLKYESPWLKLGIYVSIVGLVAYLCVLLAEFRRKKSAGTNKQ